VGGLVLSFLVFYVVPRFARVYDDISKELPVFLQGAGRGWGAPSLSTAG